MYDCITDNIHCLNQLTLATVAELKLHHVPHILFGNKSTTVSIHAENIQLTQYLKSNIMA